MVVQFISDIDTASFVRVHQPVWETGDEHQERGRLLSTKKLSPKECVPHLPDSARWDLVPLELK